MIEFHSVVINSDDILCYLHRHLSLAECLNGDLGKRA